MRYIIMGIALSIIISVTVTGCTNDSEQSYKDKKNKELNIINSDAQDR